MKLHKKSQYPRDTKQWKKNNNTFSTSSVNEKNKSNQVKSKQINLNKIKSNHTDQTKLIKTKPDKIKSKNALKEKASKLFYIMEMKQNCRLLA